MGFPESRGRLDPKNLVFELYFSMGWVAARGPPIVGGAGAKAQAVGHRRCDRGRDFQELKVA